MLLLLLLAAPARAVCIPLTAHLPVHAVDAELAPVHKSASNLRWDQAAVPCLDLRFEPWTAPVEPTAAAAHARVLAAYTLAFGPLEPNQIGWTSEALVSLPVARYLTNAERAEVQAAERMTTDVQREKATDGLGPERDGQPVYTHFLGADPRYSDVWGQPEAVVGLIEVAAAWWPRCLALVPPDQRARCTLQIGDLGWYGPLRPDPLGHYDHYLGRCVDIRLFRTDGSRYEAWWNQPDDREGFGHAYDRALTAAFVALLAERPDTFDLFFNDPEVLAQVPRAEKRPKHDDHVHVCFGVAPVK